MKIMIRLYLLIFICFYLPVPLFNPTCAAESPLKKKLTDAKGKKWAFCIGVSNYKDPGIVDLSKTQNDATGLAAALKEHGGFDHVMVFTDLFDKANPHFPSKNNILAALKHYARIIKPVDMVLFSFSGHGITTSSGRAFLLAEDSRLNRLATTGIPLDHVMAFIKKTSVKKSIILIDASREAITKKGTGPGHGIYPDRYLKKGVTAIFYSAKKGFYSYDHGNSDYGVFSRYLISGFKGEADTKSAGDGNGLVTLRELAAYVREGMSRYSFEENNKQIPSIRLFDNRQADMEISSVLKSGVWKDLKAETLTVPALRPEKSTKKTDPITKLIIKPPAPKPEDIVEVKRPDDIPEKRNQKINQEVKQVKSGDDIIIEEIKEDDDIQSGRKDRLILKDKKEGVKEEKTLTIKAQAPKFEELEEKKVVVAMIPEKDAVKKIPEPAILFLRKQESDLSATDLKSMLFRYNFYSTCWNYNGDFCNPDGSFENRFSINHDMTVTDEATGLMWQKGGSLEAMTWGEIKGYVQEMNKKKYAGYSNWRTPTVEELASIMENSWKNVDLFIAPVFDRKQRYCWSLDTNGINKAWKANFHLGFFLDFPMNEKNYVRMVRSMP